jgi:hypothetical protein
MDINLFRDPAKAELVRESQRRRFAPVEQVDLVIKVDEDWRKGSFCSLAHLALLCYFFPAVCDGYPITRLRNNDMKSLNNYYIFVLHFIWKRASDVWLCFFFTARFAVDQANKAKNAISKEVQAAMKVRFAQSKSLIFTVSLLRFRHDRSALLSLVFLKTSFGIQKHNNSSW